ncbi:vacuolar-type H+-ATPase catalytic subunit A/Vma1 [Virgibacillus halotolerans]|uniref:hypothetical protein n=1 Tax=Virgibacillus halotolerans TaxID=1071053 RepID=UPI001961E066|nr:hypothetical protein [Virgibacillus halotolerans]MBM7598189.1 vacuolar-type H+-ATPase catalytic subunit A/Vma1 [Virgibacillus halotolerans]
MEALSEPLFEINQESKYYKTKKEIKDSRPKMHKILKEIANEFEFKLDDFARYGARGFGFYQYTDSYEKYEDKLTKNADRNGVHTFKKATQEYKAISPRLVEIERIENKVNPFTLHDIFGLNNLKASQWLGDRFFVEVKSAEETKKKVSDPKRSIEFEIEPVKEISYKEYLQLLMDRIDD